MGMRFPMECLVVGYMMRDGNLAVCVDERGDPMRFIEYDDAWEMSLSLNRAGDDRSPSVLRDTWKVYTMKLQVYDGPRP